MNGLKHPGASAEQSVTMIASVDDLGQYLDPQAALQTVSEWITGHNNNQIAHHNGQGMMFAWSAGQLGHDLAVGHGVLGVTWNDEAGGYEPVVFCAARQEPVPGDEPLPEGIVEIGTVVRKPGSTIKGLGLKAVAAALELPVVQVAQTVYAVANEFSLPVFTSQSKQYIGVGGTVVTQAELETDWPFLDIAGFEDDTVVDLTPVQQHVKAPLGV